MEPSGSIAWVILQLLHISVVVAALFATEKIVTMLLDEHCRPKERDEQEKHRQEH